MNEVVIYKNSDKQIEVAVTYENETLWLTLNQIAALFERDKSVISRHIKNIYKEGELQAYATVAKNATVQQEGKRSITRKIEYYNLDVILAVGYRVSSAKGTQFRIWANNVLKAYLTKGYALNEAKLKEAQRHLDELSKSIRLIEQVTGKDDVSKDEVSGMLRVVAEYAQALDLLDQYDHQTLTTDGLGRETVTPVSYNEAIDHIKEWRDAQQAGPLFGNEKDQSFRSSIDTIYQSFDGEDLYPSIEEKAANLLYFVVKNHSFTDGNKRIAAGLFVYFLDKNNKLRDAQGNKIIPDNALVAITIMIAESKTEEKETMIKLVVNLMKQTSLS